MEAGKPANQQNKKFPWWQVITVIPVIIQAFKDIKKKTPKEGQTIAAGGAVVGITAIGIALLQFLTPETVGALVQLLNTVNPELGTEFFNVITKVLPVLSALLLGTGLGKTEPPEHQPPSKN